MQMPDGPCAEVGRGYSMRMRLREFHLHTSLQVFPVRIFWFVDADAAC